ncbi:thiamine phosphate synthase [Bizionia argentinensis JUB59]|uniref:Thiamine-phosphate synthase n=1 Tax=Bizionia argentinensis JUB59 TaxID=1046627 RepID=G2EB29_9FLAO|nr:thiamine phosphate synthase [Bizionia argentinensis]EGV44266.1 thiamine phosphate synthase [Bizionia argentinensis JUB59]
MIPKLHYISQGTTIKEHLENAQAACESGANLIQLRIKNASPKDVLKAAEEAREITNHYQTRLIINDYYKIAKQVKADGVHLGKEDAEIATAKATLFSWQIIGGTANTIEDCSILINEKVDYIGLGPYQFTNTKTNLSPVLGYSGYLTIIGELNTKTPIIAIGGITLNEVPKLLKTGVYGIAVSGEVTRNFKAISTFNNLLEVEGALGKEI